MSVCDLKPCRRFIWSWIKPDSGLCKSQLLKSQLGLGWVWQELLSRIVHGFRIKDRECTEFKPEFWLLGRGIGSIMALVTLQRSPTPSTASTSTAKDETVSRRIRKQWGGTFYRGGFLTIQRGCTGGPCKLIVLMRYIKNIVYNLLSLTIILDYRPFSWFKSKYISYGWLIGN